MSIFSRIFKRQEPLTPAEKVARLDGLDEKQLLDAIDSETDLLVRQNAVARLNGPSHLYRLATDSGSSGLTVSARKRLGELLDQRAFAVSELAGETADTLQLLELCCYSETAGTELIASIDDEQVLAHIAVSSPITALRQSAAVKIESHQLIAETLKLAQDKDKSVAKILKQKLARIKEQRARVKQLNRTAEALCQQAQSLCKREVDEIFHARKNQLDSAWSEIAADVDADVARRFTALRAQLEERHQLHDHRAELARERDARARQWQAESAGILADLNQAIARTIQQGDGERGLAEVQNLEQRFAKTAAFASENSLPVDAQAQAFAKLQREALKVAEFFREQPSLDDLVERFQENPADGQRLQAVENALALAATVADEQLPPSVARARQAIADIQEQKEALRRQHQQLVDEGFAQIRRVNAAARTGRVRRAKAMYAELEKLLAQIDDCPAALQAGFADTSQAMGRLGDWHEFAVTPKKKALITRMTKLCDSGLHPQELAEEIKFVQNEWRLLSRGGQTDDSELWQEFREAGRKAFEPCRAYFTEQEQQRQANLDKRKALCVSVQQYLENYDWENANWREVEKTLRLSRDAWTSYWPVERKQNSPLQRTFDDLMDAIHQKLDAEFERNSAQKQTIIARAADAARQDNSNEAVAEIKQLQRNWQQIGPCKPGLEQKLWRTFRTHCDAVFERRKCEQQAQQAQRQSVKSDAQALLTRFAQLLELDGDAFREARPEIDELIDRFKQLGELPKADAAPVQADFRRKLDRLEEKVHAQRLALRLAIWEEMLQAFGLLMAWELSQDDQQARSTMREAVTRQLQQSGRWPREVLEEFESRLREPPPKVPPAEAQAHFKRLCIQAETINDRPSPQADQALRMAYQVEQLQHGLGSQNPNNNMALEDFLPLWMQSPALDAATYQPLEQRMREAWGWDP